MGKEAAKLIIFLGVLLVAFGAVFYLFSKGANNLPLGLGKLPGDFSFKSGNTSVFIPLGSCVLISLLLSGVSWILKRIF